MSKRKTSTFYLTERLSVTGAGVPTAGTIDLGAYVDVGDRQAIAVEEVDFIWQGGTPGTEVPDVLGANNGAFCQLTDLNRGGVLVYADDRALIASGNVYCDAGLNPSHSLDMYPDVFGARDGVRLVINDQMYCVAQANAVGASGPLEVTVRVKCHITTLSQKDWMAIAIQSTAADN